MFKKRKHCRQKIQYSYLSEFNNHLSFYSFTLQLLNVFRYHSYFQSLHFTKLSRMGFFLSALQYRSQGTELRKREGGCIAK